MIKKLSLEQKLLWPIIIVLILLHLGLFAVHFDSIEKADVGVEINLYRSFKEEGKKRPMKAREGNERYKAEKATEAEGGKEGEDDYLSRVYQQIEAHKSYPLEEKQRGHEGKVKVGLVILADGALGKVWLVEPCSYEKLNEAAQLAVKQAAPFPKVPKSFNQDQLSIILKVAFKLL